MVLRALRRVGQGYFLADGATKRLRMADPSLELSRTKFTRGGRIVWQVGRGGRRGGVRVCLAPPCRLWVDGLHRC